jgi:uncharacterized Zn finger protein
MPEDKDEFHHCPACNRRTRHRVSSDRKLAPVLWCQTCFHVHVHTEGRTESDDRRKAAERAA